MYKVHRQHYIRIEFEECRLYFSIKISNLNFLRTTQTGFAYNVYTDLVRYTQIAPKITIVPTLIFIVVYTVCPQITLNRNNSRLIYEKLMIFVKCLHNVFEINEEKFTLRTSVRIFNLLIYLLKNNGYLLFLAYFLVVNNRSLGI